MNTSESLNIEKLWNWNMDNKCMESCANVFIVHIHVINAFSLVMFLLLCYLTTSLINYQEHKNFKISTQELLYTSILVYVSWNLFFGFPIKNMKGDQDELTVGYTTYGISQLTSILIATLILFLNKTC